MADKWYAVCDKATGELISTGSVIADPLPDHLEKIELAQAPDWKTQDWDAEKKALTEKPAQARRRDLLRVLDRLTIDEARALLKAGGLTNQRIQQLEDDA